MKVVTRKGTVIKRYARTGVGKLVAGRLYVHVSCISDAFLKASGFGVGRWNRAMSCHRDHWEAWAANCVMLDLKTGEVRFDQAPLFDQEREPHVGKWLKVLPGGGTRIGHSDAIWHHKWTFVNPSYRGFDVQESMEWSRTYLARLRQPPKGYLKPWLEQLREVGLE